MAVAEFLELDLGQYDDRVLADELVAAAFVAHTFRLDPVVVAHAHEVDHALRLAAHLAIAAEKAAAHEAAKAHR